MIETKSTTFYKIKNLTTLHLNKIKQPKAKPSQFKKMKTLFISQQLSKLSIIEVQKTYKIAFFQKYNIEIKPAYTNRKISNYFNNKSICSETFDANFIYKYNCSEDQNISYVVETSRQFFQQIEDHKRSN